MRMREVEAAHRRRCGVVTMDDIARERMDREAQERRKAEREHQAKKAATRGAALFEVDHA